MFNIETQDLGPFKLYKLIDQTTGEFATIFPGFGAALNNLSLQTADGRAFDVIAGYQDYAHFQEFSPKSYWSCILFPSPNRVRGGKYSYNGQAYQLPQNEIMRGHSLHGLLFNRAFEVVAQAANDIQASVTLQYEGKGEDAGFPFSYLVKVEYILMKNSGLTCKTTVTNTDNQTIPVGVGWHPYFKTGSKVDDLNIGFAYKNQLELDDVMIPTGKNLDSKVPHELFSLKDVSFDSGFELNETEAIAITRVQDPKQNLNLLVWQVTGPNQYNYLQIYTPPHRDNIAIEPMTCAPDAFNNKQGLIELAPGQAFATAYGVKVV